MMFSSVDLPDPEGPVIASQSPRLTTRSISTSAVTTGSKSKLLQTLLSSSTLLSATEQRSSAIGSWCRSTSASPIRILVAHDHELPGDKLAFGRCHFDIATRGQAGRHGHIFKNAFILDLDARCAVGGQGHGADRNGGDGTLRGLDRNGEPHGNAVQLQGCLVDSRLEVEVEAVDTACAWRGRDHRDHARGLDPERLLVD